MAERLALVLDRRRSRYAGMPANSGVGHPPCRSPHGCWCSPTSVLASVPVSPRLAREALPFPPQEPGSTPLLSPHLTSGWMVNPTVMRVDIVRATPGATLYQLLSRLSASTSPGSPSFLIKFIDTELVGSVFVPILRYPLLYISASYDLTFSIIFWVHLTSYIYHGLFPYPSSLSSSWIGL